MSNRKNRNVEEKEDCKLRMNTTAMFKKPIFESWFDPSNWISVSTSIPTKVSQSTNQPSAIPHLQQVPCRYDKVSFPSNAAYKVISFLLVLRLFFSKWYLRNPNYGCDI
jgi:hypothetical protein